MKRVFSSFTVREVRRGLLHLGSIEVALELNTGNELQIIIDNSGAQYGERKLKNLPNNGYDDWKKAIAYGFNFAYKNLKECAGLTIYLRGVAYSHLDTSPTILAYVAMRSVIDKIEHTLSNEHLKCLEGLVFQCWEYDYFAQPDFDACKILGQKILSRYNDAAAPKNNPLQ